MKTNKLIILDIDNTVFDWVTYYVKCMESLFKKINSLTQIPEDVLAAEAKEVFAKQGSIEYPFLIQELPSVAKFYGNNISKMLREAVEQGRQVFKDTASNYLKPYPSVIATFETIKEQFPEYPIAALTDAPRYVAMWKLNKLGILHYFSSLYGLSDPKIPIDPKTEQVKVDAKILTKHLKHSSFDFKGRIRTLPEDYEKPGTKGLKTVLMDYEMETHSTDVLWVGDNLKKDIGLGKELGIISVWAEYGTHIEDKVKKQLLTFSPEINIHKNVALDPASHSSPEPDVVLSDFSEILPVIEKL